MIHCSSDCSMEHVVGSMIVQYLSIQKPLVLVGSLALKSCLRVLYTASGSSPASQVVLETYISVHIYYSTQGHVVTIYTIIYCARKPEENNIQAVNVYYEFFVPQNYASVCILLDCIKSKFWAIRRWEGFRFAHPPDLHIIFIEIWLIWYIEVWGKC